MQKYIKTYLSYYGIEQDNIRCEVCGMMSVDVHHIQPRSKFGKKTKHLQDDITNLIALCREDHKKAHLQIEPYLRKQELQDIHNKNL